MSKSEPKINIKNMWDCYTSHLPFKNFINDPLTTDTTREWKIIKLSFSSVSVRPPVGVLQYIKLRLRSLSLTYLLATKCPLKHFKMLCYTALQIILSKLVNSSISQSAEVRHSRKDALWFLTVSYLLWFPKNQCQCQQLAIHTHWYTEKHAISKWPNTAVSPQQCTHLVCSNMTE